VEPDGYGSEADWILAVRQVSLGALQCVVAEVRGRWNVGLTISTTAGEPVERERLQLLREALLPGAPAGVELELRSI
jgi:hypothetical protein